MKKICAHCGAEFESHDKRRKYCSRKCRLKQKTFARMQRYRAENTFQKKTCAMCGAEFTPTKHNKQKYCSVKCQKKHYNDQRERKPRKIRKESYYTPKPPTTKTCQFCGVEFESHHGLQKYCSVKCQRKDSYKRRKVDDGLVIVRRTLYKKTCAFCGKEFLARSEKQKFCGRKCAAADYHKKLRESLPPEPEVSIIIQDATGTFTFNQLSRAAKFLAFYTNFDLKQVQGLLQLKKAQIGSYKIFYGG